MFLYYCNMRNENQILRYFQLFIALLEEKSKNLSTKMLSFGFFVVHNALRSCHHNVPKMNRNAVNKRMTGFNSYKQFRESIEHLSPSGLSHSSQGILEHTFSVLVYPPMTNQHRNNTARVAFRRNHDLGIQN